MDLNAVMEFDHVITVQDDGTVTDGPAGVYAPEVCDGEIYEGPWELMNGYSGQWCYSGPWMHPSEYIGGRLAEDILATPGVYVAVVDDVGDGWTVARYIVKES